jgi:hypothetical protein
MFARFKIPDVGLRCLTGLSAGSLSYLVSYETKNLEIKHIYPDKKVPEYLHMVPTTVGGTIGFAFPFVTLAGAIVVLGAFIGASSIIKYDEWYEKEIEKHKSQYMSSKSE